MACVEGEVCGQRVKRTYQNALGGKCAVQRIDERQAGGVEYEGAEWRERIEFHIEGQTVVGHACFGQTSVRAELPCVGMDFCGVHMKTFRATPGTQMSHRDMRGAKNAGRIEHDIHVHVANGWPNIHVDRGGPVEAEHRNVFAGNQYTGINGIQRGGALHPRTY